MPVDIEGTRQRAVNNFTSTLYTRKRTLKTH